MSFTLLSFFSPTFVSSPNCAQLQIYIENTCNFFFQLIGPREHKTHTHTYIYCMYIFSPSILPPKYAMECRTKWIIIIYIIYNYAFSHQLRSRDTYMILYKCTCTCFLPTVLLFSFFQFCRGSYCGSHITLVWSYAQWCVSKIIKYTSLGRDYKILISNIWDSSI